MLRSLASSSFRRRRLTVAIWLALVVIAVTASSAFGSRFNTAFSLDGAESDEARALLSSAGFDEGADETGLVVIAADAGLDNDGVRSTVETVFSQIEAAVDDVAVVQSLYEPGGENNIAASGNVGFAVVDLGVGSSAEITERAADVVDAARSVEVGDVTIEFGGEPFYEEAEFSSEGIGLIAAVVILLFAFGSVLAMGLPIGTALFGIGVAVGVVTLLTRVMAVPDFAIPVTAMVGIGVGIDYALFIVTRYRQNLHHGNEPQHAVGEAIATAGRSVLFAGSTVVVSLLGLILVNLAAIRTAALAAALGVLFVMAASLTLLPALLGFVGTHIDRFRLPGRSISASAIDRDSIWFKWSRTLQKRPVVSATAGLVVLLVLAAPTMSIRLGFSDAGNRLDTDTSRRAYDLIATEFGPGFNGPLILAVDVSNTSDPGTFIGQLDDTLAATGGIAAAVPTQLNAAGDVGIIEVFPTTSPQDAATSDLVQRLRDDIIPSVADPAGATVLVGGATAAAVDFSDYLSARLGVFIGTVLVLSFVLLTFVFRSILVPFKAVIMNLLSIGAAYGVLVAVFQWGWGAGLLGVGEPGPIEAWAPLMLFAIVFGLSMDYEVFLLSRIKEEYDRTGDNSTSVADGLAGTARLITAAAAIMVCVFGAFVLSGERALQIFGLGLAVAVLADATIVRLVIVPATMELLGDRNWWLPTRLRTLLETRTQSPKGATHS